MRNIERLLIILWILIVCAALITANWFQIFKHLTPCTFCLFQRISMVGIGIGALMNLRFGIRVEHYALSILFAILGVMISYRLEPFGGYIWGYSLSSWSAMVFVGSIIGPAVLLIMYSKTKLQDTLPRWGLLEKGVFYLFSFLVVIDIFTVLSLKIL